VAFTYDPDCLVGKVRLLCTDRDEDYPIFTDAEIGVFLGLNNEDAFLAAAQALDQIAATEALLLKHITINGLSTNGKTVADALHAQAEILRKQSLDGSEMAELILGPPSRIAPDIWRLV